MKKFLAGIGILALPFSAVVGANTVFADGGVEKEQQNLSVASNENKGDLVNTQSTKKGAGNKETVKEKSIAELFDAESIKDEAFSTKIATLEDVEFMAENMPAIQGETWLKTADLIKEKKTKEQWKEIFSKRIKNKNVEEILVKDKAGKIVGSVEVHKISHIYRCYFVSMNEHKGLLKKVAQGLLINFSKNAPKGSVVEILFDDVEDGIISEYERFCEDTLSAVKDRYSFVFRRSRFNVKSKKGLKVLAIQL